MSFPKLTTQQKVELVLARRELEARRDQLFDQFFAGMEEAVKAYIAKLTTVGIPPDEIQQRVRGVYFNGLPTTGMPPGGDHNVPV